MEQTIFAAVHSLAVFLFSMCLLPWLLKRGHLTLSVILPLGVFLILAQLNPNSFDFIERIWRGLAMGVVSVVLGFVYHQLLKRRMQKSKT
jgi:4-amino-4-deoxy-L-arabinose transferase-like glycosyltransferase